MKPNYKFLTDIDLSSNIIANVSKIVGNDYPDITPDLEITTEDAKSSKSYGNLLLRAGSDTNASGGYVHIYAGDSIEPKETEGNGGLWIYPSKKIRVEDDAIQYYFSSVFELYGNKSGTLDTSTVLFTKYNTKGSFTTWVPTEDSIPDKDSEGTSYTIRNKSDYYRIEATDYIDLDSVHFDLYSQSNINIHTKSRGAGTLTFTSGKLESNHNNIVIDNAANYTQYTGNKFEINVGDYEKGDETTDPSITDRSLHLILDDNDHSLTIGNETLTKTISGDDYFEVKSDLIKFDSTTSGSGLFQIDTQYFDLNATAGIGLTTPIFNLDGDDIHLRSNVPNQKGSIHILYGNQSAENTYKGLILYDNGDITLSTENIENANYNSYPLPVTSAFVKLSKNNIDIYGDVLSEDIDSTYELNVGTSNQTNLNITDGNVIYNTDSEKDTIDSKLDYLISSEADFDIYHGSTNTDSGTSEITSSIVIDASRNPINRRFSFATEKASGSEWNSKTNASDSVTNREVIVGRIDNFKINKVFNMGMNKNKFSIYWDEFTSSLVFTQGEILWQ